jgi:hypothetical protein
MNFAKAQDKMLEYLRSPEFSNRSDSQHTLPSLPILEECIRRGLLTTGSQEGVCVTGYTDSYYRIEERAYLSGFMTQSHAKQFVERMNTETDKIAFITQVLPRTHHRGSFAISTIPITVSGTSVRRWGIKLYPESAVPLAVDIDSFTLDKKHAFLNRREAVYQVQCIDPVYCRRATSVRGLYKDVVQILGKC